MSLFSNALRGALDDLGWSQTHLSEVTGIPRPQVNRYARGTSSVETDGLEKILVALPAPHKSTVLAAYLRDAIPTQFSGLITILEDDSKIEEEPNLPKMDPELRDTIFNLARLASRHTEIRDLLTKFQVALRPRN